MQQNGIGRRRIHGEKRPHGAIEKSSDSEGIEQIGRMSRVGTVHFMGFHIAQATTLRRTQPAPEEGVSGPGSEREWRQPVPDFRAHGAFRRGQSIRLR